MAESVNGKIKRFLCSDLLLERAWLSARDTRWSRKKSPSFGHTINPLLTKLVPWRWLYIGLVYLYILMDRTLATLAYSNECWTFHCIMQLFRERLSEKMCTRQSRRVIWDMINTLFLTLQLTNLLLLLSFRIRKHTSMASRAILSNFFVEQRTQNHSQYLSGLSRALFPTTFLETAVYLIHHSSPPFGG